MKKENMKADLTLLKRCFSEVETALELAYKVRDENKTVDPKDNHNDFIVSLSKAMGLMMMLYQEAGLLVGDLQKIAQYSTPKKDKDASDILSNIFGSLPAKSGGRDN